MYGERIKEKRKEYQISRTDLAELIGTTPQVIKLWEEERTEPSIGDLIALSKELEVSVDWLIGIIDYLPDEDEYGEEDNEDDSCEYDEFIQNNLIPHMNRYLTENEEPSYIHIQFSGNDDSADCMIYSGGIGELISSINLFLKSMSNELGVDYYDFVAFMATMFAKSDLEEYLGDE